MPLSRALALCPDIVLRPVDMPYYKQVSEKVMGVLARHAAVLERASIDEAFLDCTAMAENDPYEHAAKIKRAIREECGLLSSIGVAPSKSAAKIASDFKKPDGLTIVHPDHVQKFLAPLEVGRISGVGPKTQLTLAKIGIETIGQLAACDVQKLTGRFGRNVSLSTEHTLEEFTRDKDRIFVYLDGLVDEVYGRLVRRGYMFRTVGVKIMRADFTIETREVSFQELQARRESISSVIGPLLGRFSFGDSTPLVRKVGLRVTNLASMDEEETEVRSQKTLLDYL
jgi:DNA polymerase IV (DinB-like DNA polymerase)